MVNFAVWVAVGGALGWIVSRLGGRGTPPGRLVNVLAGVDGALLAGLVITPLFTLRATPPDQVSALTLLVAVGGAGFLVMVMNLPRRVR